MPASACPEVQKPIQSAFGKPTHPMSHLAAKLKNPRAMSRLNIAFSITAFLNYKRHAVAWLKQGDTERARAWAAEARAEWRIISAWLGLPAPQASR